MSTRSHSSLGHIQLSLPLLPPPLAAGQCHRHRLRHQCCQQTSQEMICRRPAVFRSHEGVGVEDNGLKHQRGVVIGVENNGLKHQGIAVDRVEGNSLKPCSMVVLASIRAVEVGNAVPHFPQTNVLFGFLLERLSVPLALCQTMSWKVTFCM